MKRSAFSIALGYILLVSCGSGEKRLPTASGAQGELLVVMDKGHWEGEPGALVRGILEQPITSLPQREPRFKVVQCAPQHFGNLLKSHHTIIVASIGAKDTAGTRRMTDRYARGQLVVQVAATTAEEWNRAFASDADGIVRALEKHQLERVVDRLGREKDAAVSSEVKTALGIDLDIPGGYRVMGRSDHAMWLERDRMVSGSGLQHNVIEGLLFHRHPYVSDTVFSVPNLVEQRDSVTRDLVNGPTPGSYMIVQRRFETLDLMPQGMATEVNGNYAYLMRGLFGMEGAKMGGPFVSLSTVRESEGELITVEGFVYAPQFNKREYVRELEAILFSMGGTDTPSALKAKE